MKYRSVWWFVSSILLETPLSQNKVHSSHSKGQNKESPGLAEVKYPDSLTALGSVVGSLPVYTEKLVPRLWEEQYAHCTLWHSGNPSTGDPKFVQKMPCPWRVSAVQCWQCASQFTHERYVGSFPQVIPDKKEIYTNFKTFMNESGPLSNCTNWYLKI